MKRILLAIAMLAWSMPCHAEMPLVTVADHLTDGEITLIYGPWLGRIWLESDNQTLTSLRLTSESGLLTGETPDHLMLPGDTHTPFELSITRPEGIFGDFGSNLSFGQLAAPGLGSVVVAADFTLTGTVLGDEFGFPNLAIGGPEPTSFGLTTFAFLGVACFMRTGLSVNQRC